ncbi:aldose epimerase family protein [Dysgonomonas termitidis]
MVARQKPIINQGKEVKLFRITNSSGAYVEVMNYGATIVSVVVPGKDGLLGNVVLKYDDITDYFTDEFYIGCTVGRYANRISKARFPLNGKTYHVDKNDGMNSNHGGFNGLNKKVFDCNIMGDKVEFISESSDGEGGFPGNLRLSVIYAFSEDNELDIVYRAVSDKATPVSFTNHSYFNLDSTAEGDVSAHKLRIDTGNILEMDNTFLPTGKILAVDGSAFDFRLPGIIREKMKAKNDNLKGYNAFYIKEKRGMVDPFATVSSQVSGRQMDVYTTMPGIMLYTGDFLSGRFMPMGGLCIEAQYYPDGVNHPYFVSNILKPFEEQTDMVRYHFR